MELGLVAIVVAIIGPFLTYLISSRKMSGEIRHSEATELWAESRSIREYSSGRIKELDDHIDDLEERLTKVELANTELAADNRKLMREIYDYRSRIQNLQEDKSTLTRLLAQEQELTAHLKEAANLPPHRRRDDPPLVENGDTS